MFFTRRRVIDVLRPEARVIGAAPGERFETSGVSESLRVVANLGEQARSGDDAGKARDDGIVGVLAECLDGGSEQLIDVGPL